MTKIKKEKVVKVKPTVEPIVEPIEESEGIKALRALFAAQKLATPRAYEDQNKDAELERRIKAL